MLPDRPWDGKVLEGKDPRKTALSIGVVLLVILLASIFLGVRQKKANDYKASYSDRLIRAENLYNDALTQRDTNLINARELFQDAQDIVSSLEAEGVQDEKLNALKVSMAQVQTDILGTAHVPTTLFLDLSLVRDNIDAKEASFANGQIAVLDSAGGRVISVGAKDKKTNVSGASDKLSSAKSASAFDGRTYVLASGGIVEVDAKGSSKVVVEDDSEWSGAQKVAAFGSNIYLLENSGKIWKYPAASTPTGFGSKQEWLKVESAPAGNAIDWAIDGSVYVLSDDGGMGKYTRGAKDGFRLGDIPGSLSGATAIYTDPEMESLFILDKEGGRIIETEKTGSYKLEYIAEEVKNADDFVVSVAEGKIFLLSQNKLFEMPLKK